MKTLRLARLAGVVGLMLMVQGIAPAWAYCGLGDNACFERQRDRQQQELFQQQLLWEQHQQTRALEQQRQDQWLREQRRQQQDEHARFMQRLYGGTAAPYTLHFDDADE